MEKITNNITNTNKIDQTIDPAFEVSSDILENLLINKDTQSNQNIADSQMEDKKLYSDSDKKVIKTAGKKIRMDESIDPAFAVSSDISSFSGNESSLSNHIKHVDIIGNINVKTDDVQNKTNKTDIIPIKTNDIATKELKDTLLKNVSISAKNKNLAENSYRKQSNTRISWWRTIP